MINRECRNKLIDAIKSYINEEITAFRFDEIIMDEIETEDSTVNGIINLLWYFYDDCHDHKVHLIKYDWDFYHRMILILESEDTLRVTPSYIWNIRQLIAMLCLAVFICAVFVIGLGIKLLAVTVPLGIVSIWLSHWKARSVCKEEPHGAVMFPFSKFSELSQFRRKVSKFKKPPLPEKFNQNIHYNSGKKSRCLLYTSPSPRD